MARQKQNIVEGIMDTLLGWGETMDLDGYDSEGNRYENHGCGCGFVCDDCGKRCRCHCEDCCKCRCNCGRRR